MQTTVNRWCSSSCFFFHRLYSARRKRAASFIIFTEDQVHILPGYPKQISTDPLLASLAFYLQFPPGTSDVDAIAKDTLVSVVKGSIADISNTINGNISSVQTLVAETSTTVTSTEAPSRPTEKDSDKLPYIIGGSVAGGMLVIIIAVIIIWRCSKPKNRQEKDGDLYRICYIHSVRLEKQMRVIQYSHKYMHDIVLYFIHLTLVD